MKKIILVVLLFIVACSTANYNTPFVNADETIKLEFGMTMDEVEKNFGQIFSNRANKTPRVAMANWCSMEPWWATTFLFATRVLI